MRCGQCEHVFNALDRLAKVDDAATSQPPGAAEAGELAGVTTPVTQQPVTQQKDTHPYENAAPDSAEPAPAVRPILADEAAFKLTDFSLPGKDNILSPAMMADSVRDKAGVERRRKPVLLKLLLTLLAAVLILSMLAQTVYFLRSDIAARWPQTRPQLEHACQLFDCKVELPKNADLIAIEDSELEEDADRRGLIHLYVTIINHAGYSQAYPLLELTLTDTYDKPLIRRAFKPEEYLSDGVDQTTGIAAKQNVRIKLSFTTDNQAIAGYRVFLTY